MTERQPLSQSPADDPGRALSGREITFATAILMGSFVLSGSLGLVRTIVLTAVFGAGSELDAFYAALRLPETLFTLVAGGALGSAFIPVFSRFLNQDDFAGAWRLASAVMTLVTLAAILSATFGFIFAEPLVETLLLPGRSADQQALTVELMRIMLVTVVIFGLSGLLMGILNAYQHFITPALAPSMYNIGIIVGTFLLVPSMGVHGLAWATVLGAGLHMLVQIPVLRGLSYARIVPVFDIQIPGVLEVLTLMGPRLVGLMVVQVNFWVNISLASTMGLGSITALQTAYTLMFTALGVLGQSVGTAVFPSLSAFFAQEDMEGFNRTLTSALRNVLFLSIPAGIGMMAVSVPLIAVLFERGEWTAAATSATAWVLIFYAVGLTGHAALEILARTFYALHDTWTPVVIGVGAMILNIVLSVAFILLFDILGAERFPRGPFAGLALANSVATALESTILWFLLRRRVPTLNPTPVVQTLVRTLLASLGMGAIVLVWLTFAEDLFVLWQLLIGIALGMLSFALLAILLRIDTAQTLLARLRR